MPKVNIGPRISPEAAKFYETSFENKNQGATCALSLFPNAYTRTLVELRGVFTQGELNFFIDIMNGTIALMAGQASGLFGQHLPLSASDSFDLYPGMYEDKWGVKKDLVMAKLEGLTVFQLMAIELWSALFWAVPDINAEGAIKNYSKILMG